MVVTVCFSFMSQESWTSHLCVPSLLQLHGTEEKSDRRRLAREDKQIDRWKEIFLKGRLNRVQGAVQSSFPWQQRFVGYIQVAEEDDHERFKILDLFKKTYAFWFPR